MQRDRVLGAAATFINKRSHMSDFYAPAKPTVISEETLHININQLSRFRYKQLLTTTLIC